MMGRMVEPVQLELQAVVRRLSGGLIEQMLQVRVVLLKVLAEWALRRDPW